MKISSMYFKTITILTLMCLLFSYTTLQASDTCNTKTEITTYSNYMSWFKSSFLNFFAKNEANRTIFNSEALDDLPFSSIINNCLTADSLELVNLYNMTNGDNWINNDGWLTAPVSEWYGVGINLNDCNLFAIDLNNNNLHGTLPNLDLSNLVHLRLYDNELEGNIPSFENLPNLTQLSLSNNQLVGSIPDFSNSPNLTILYLNHNQLTGIIPNFNLPNLESLYLNHNQLTGVIPNFNLSNLTYLYLQENNLSGNLPDFSISPSLDIIVVQGNNLDGEVPIFNNLNVLAIDGNQYNFEDLENTVQNSTNINLFYYAPQADIPTYQNGNELSVNAGGNIIDNTYTWYKDGVAFTPITGNNTFTVTVVGNYHCEVTNSEITNPAEVYQNLILESNEIFVSPTPTTNCLTADSLELVNLYNMTNGDNWINNDGWLTASLNEWYGITLTNDGCGIQQIILSNNNLVGEMMDLNLPNLTHLSLNYNQI